MHDAIPRPAIWRALGLGAVVLLAVPIALISLISSGIFDPRPVGTLQQEVPLEEITLSAGDNTLTWLLDVVLPAPPFTLRLEAGSDGAAVSYGLALGTPDDYLAAIVSQAGYAGVTAHTPHEARPLLPWRPTTLITPGEPGNELQIDVTEARTSIWLNRQHLWEGPAPAGAAQVALVASSNTEPGTVRFELLQLFAPSWR